MRKGQISIEYLFILAMSLAIIIPGSMMFFRYSQESNEQLVASQINRIGTNVITTAEEIYTVGDGSWITLDVTIPQSAKDAYVEGDDLVIEYRSSSGITEAVFFSDIDIQGPYADGAISPSFHTGTMQIRVESKGDYVLIQEYLS